MRPLGDRRRDNCSSVSLGLRSAAAAGTFGTRTVTNGWPWRGAHVHSIGRKRVSLMTGFLVNRPDRFGIVGADTRAAIAAPGRLGYCGAVTGRHQFRTRTTHAV